VSVPAVERRVETVPRLALTPEEAAKAIGVGRSFFFEHVLPQLELVRVGRRRIIPVDALKAWLDENAERALP
jgi:excisionase family DNA binding protein